MTSIAIAFIAGMVIWLTAYCLGKQSGREQSREECYEQLRDVLNQGSRPPDEYGQGFYGQLCRVVDTCNALKQLRKKEPHK